MKKKKKIKWRASRALNNFVILHIVLSTEY